MKNISIYLMLLIAFISISNASDNISLASRYVKLANTYIHTQDYNNVFVFLKKAESSLMNRKGWDADYWRAAIYETYGIAFLKMDIIDEAKIYLQNALQQYKILVSMPQGSHIALSSVIASIENSIYMIEVGETGSNAVKGIASFANVVNFDNEKLRELPVGIPNSTENISLANNNFRNFPLQLAVFNNIKYINLSNNKISNISISGKQFESLIWLNLSNNRIKQVSAGLSSMKNLQFLDLSDNKLRSLPNDITQLTNLKVLNLKGNRIPFASVKTIIQALPNTNIIHDEYVPKEIEDYEETEW